MLSQLKLEGNFLNLINDTHEKPKSNIVFNGERLNASP